MSGFAWRRCLLAGALTALAGCGSMNPFADSDRKLAPLPAYVPGSRLSLDWQLQLKGSPVYALIPAHLTDGAIIVAGADGVVERHDGAALSWRSEIGSALSAGVGSDGKLAVVVTARGEAVALDAATGAVKWRASVGAEVLAAPNVAAPAVIVRASDSRIFGLSPSDGRRLWIYQRPTPPLALRSHAALLVQDDIAVAGFPGGKMVAINLGNGGAIWELSVALPRGSTELERVADVVGTPVLFQRTLCAVAYQGRTACFDAANGNLLWSREVASAVGLDRDEQQVFVTDEKGAVQAFDASTGASLWKQDKLAGRGTGRPLVLGKQVLVADAEGYVSVLHREDGTLLARQATDGSPVAADLVATGADSLVVQTSKGGVFALSTR